MSNAVAKLIPKEPGAQREMLFADLAGVRNVVPIIDSGETEDAWVLVMPRAEKSLREHLDSVAGALDITDATGILVDIATSLADLDRKVVHRDLKPENVLLLDGRWCLADFGISRYAEASTAPDTQKFAWTAQYAGPERWRHEHAEISTDVYSLGVMAYEMVNGVRPFLGPTREDYRQQHLHDNPPALTGAPPSFAALVDACLNKAPGARPTPADVVKRLGRSMENAPSAGLAALQEASRAEGARRAEQARGQSHAQSEEERREALFQSAIKEFARISASLKQAILAHAPEATVREGPGNGWSLDLNTAELRLGAYRQTSREPWRGWEAPAFEVIAHTSIGIKIPRDRYDYEGRSHSLWYCDAQEQGHYQWFETAFMVSAVLPRRFAQNPYALDPGEESAKAVGSGMAEYQVAWPFMPIASDDLADFIGRWAGWLAAASTGRLTHPSEMPERRDVRSSWRR
jgi:hypothetical protein